MIETIGFVAGGLTTLAFVPQVMKTWRSRSADGLSGIMLADFSVGLLLWIVYGFAIASWSLIVTNAITFSLTATLLVLKFRR